MEACKQQGCFPNDGVAWLIRSNPNPICEPATNDQDDGAKLVGGFLPQDSPKRPAIDGKVLAKTPLSQLYGVRSTLYTYVFRGWGCSPCTVVEVLLVYILCMYGVVSPSNMVENAPYAKRKLSRPLWASRGKPHAKGSRRVRYSTPYIVLEYLCSVLRMYGVVRTDVYSI